MAINDALLRELAPYGAPRAGRSGTGTRFIRMISAYVTVYNDLDRQAGTNAAVMKAVMKVTPFFMVKVDKVQDGILEHTKRASEALRARLLHLIMMRIAAFAVSSTHKYEQNNRRWQALLAIGEAALAEGERTGLKLMSNVGDGGAKAANGLSSRWLECVLEEPWSSVEAADHYDRWVGDVNIAGSFQAYLSQQMGPYRSHTMLEEVFSPPMSADLSLDSKEIQREPGALWTNAVGQPVDTSTWRPYARPTITSVNWGIFAASWSGTIYVGQDLEGWHHSSFLAGRPVLAAGLMRFVGGTLRAITAESGHYQPTPGHMLDLVMRNRDIASDTLIMPFHPDHIPQAVTTAVHAHNHDIQGRLVPNPIAPTIRAGRLGSSADCYFYSVYNFRRLGLAVCGQPKLIVSEAQYREQIG